VAAAAVRGREPEPLSRHATGVVGRQLEGLDRHAELGTAKARREARRSLGELVAKPFAARRRGAEGDHRSGVAEPRPIGQHALLRHLHGAGDGGAHGDGVEPGAVAGVVGLDDRLEVADPAGRAEGPDALVLGPLAGGVAGRGAPRATDAASAAGRAALEEVAPQRLARDGRGMLELRGAEVPRRQDTSLVQDVHEHRRPELGQRLRRDRVRLEELLGLIGDERQPVRIGDHRAMAAVVGDDHRLEALGAHHRPQAAASDRPSPIVDDGGEEDAALAGRADDAGLGAGMGVAQASKRGGHLHAPQLARGEQGDLDPVGGGEDFADGRAAGARGRPARAAGGALPAGVSADHEAGRRLAGPGDDEVVDAQAAQRHAEAAPGVAVEERPCERRTRGDAVAPRSRGVGARQRAWREDEQVLGRERLHFVQPLAQGDAGAQPATAEVGPGDVGGRLLGCRDAAREVDAQTMERSKGRDRVAHGDQYSRPRRRARAGA